ncbi:alcohol dehydrogenase [Atractiella rhizophila]|nr:alcohol dehydrogenase [Atractiella rhizophila]
MSPIPNPRLYLKKPVEANTYPVPNENLAYDDKETIDIDSIELKPGELLVETLCVSLDPYMRGRMRKDGESYAEPFTVGDPITGAMIGKVLKSSSEKFQEGHLVNFGGQYRKFSKFNEAALPIRQLPDVKVPSSTFLGVLGMPGMTAWAAWREYAHAKKGETCFVSTGAGAVGSLVIQLAKMDGLKVIASAGSDSKLEYMKKLGADEVFNYKTTKTSDALKSFGKIDVYWVAFLSKRLCLDNVGGEQTDAALANMNVHGRIIVCGVASQYSAKPVPIHNYDQILVKRLQINGFLQGDIRHKHEESFWKTLPQKVVSGELQFQEAIYHGFDKGPEAFDDLLRGKNEGKVVVMA